MRILRMQAVFGCLDDAVLELQPGVNVLKLPNEHGKSTWAAFLLAMFYGIDTAQRAVKGRLPEKTRYQPWNGKAMAGQVELEHEGRILVLQRTSLRGKPLGVLQVYDKDTGMTLPEITAENCGMYFLGVERSVFRRSAFLSGEELAVSQDETLAQRLENLAASGESAENYPAAAARLKQWKNRIRYHQSGLLPEAESRLRQTRQQLTQLQTIDTQRQEAAERQKECLRHAEAMEQAERAQWQREKDAAEERLSAAAAAWELQQADTTGTVEQAQQALEEYEKLTRGRKKAALWPLGAAAAAVLAGLLGVKLQWCALLCVLLLIPCGLLWLRARRQDEKDKKTAAALLEQWGAKEKAALLPGAVERSRLREQAFLALKQAQTAAEAARQPYRLSPMLQAQKDHAAAWQLEAESRRGQLQAMGDPAALQKRAEELTRQVQALQEQEEALTLAQAALDAAEQRQAQVYAPQLTKLAGEYLSRLTGGRYDTVVLERGFALQAGERESGLLRPAAALSSGAQDQLWLSLRLAMTRLLLPADTPIWLDDALLTFDESRTARAMELLAEENRQVIVMGCK